MYYQEKNNRTLVTTPLTVRDDATDAFLESVAEDVREITNSYSTVIKVLYGKSKRHGMDYRISSTKKSLVEDYLKKWNKWKPSTCSIQKTFQYDEGRWIVDIKILVDGKEENRRLQGRKSIFMPSVRFLGSICLLLMTLQLY